MRQYHLILFIIFCAIFGPGAVHAASAVDINQEMSGASLTGRNVSAYANQQSLSSMTPYMTQAMKNRLEINAARSASVTTANNIRAVQTGTMAKNSGNVATGGKRGVVARSGASMARAGTTSMASSVTSTSPARVASSASAGRGVVARSGTSTARAGTTSMARSTTNARSGTNTINQSTAIVTDDPNASAVSSDRCIADYQKCMDGYCLTETSKYKRCFCSDRLIEIENGVQPSIDGLMEEIVASQIGDSASKDYMSIQEMQADLASLGSLENSLKIDWAKASNQLKGQAAYDTANNYCLQHLQGCYYMQSTLKNVYRSEVNKACMTYEAGLKQIEANAKKILCQRGTTKYCTIN